MGRYLLIYLYWKEQGYMSESNSHGRRDGGQRGGNPQGRYSRNDDRRGGRREDRFRGKDGVEQRGERRGSRGDDRRDDRRDDRSYGRREDGRSDRRNDRRDDRRGGYRGGRSEDGGNRAERRGHGGRRDDRRENRGREENKSHSPQRSGYREERINRRQNDPEIPADIDANDLDPSVLQDLKSLSKDNADATAKHMIMAAMWMDDNPQLALQHARAAKDRAGRVSVAREINGVAAYHAGEWKEALAELRAARRISGGPGLLAVMADCERGLGRPEKAIELGRSEDARLLDPESAIELAIVVAGARLDMGQAESAVVTLQRANPNKDDRGMSACRLSYAYANALLEAGRTEDAREWFVHTKKIDEEGWTDAEVRLEELP
nr:hypothetical protein [uncultured Corynebacterium sp.]